ncbi:MAG: hypothetical protein JWL58_3680 [Streptosporangiaceae bacterium]|nr:hypothetical protein [Streptosporangiaceae bacterium]
MTDVTIGSAYRNKAMRLMQSDRVYVGWRYAQAHQDPGPPPARPEPPAAEPPGTGAQRPVTLGENLLNRPLKTAMAGTGVVTLIFVAAWASGLLPGRFALVALGACGLVFGITGSAIWQGEQAARARRRQERDRTERARQNRQRSVDAAQHEHAVAYRDWERRRQAYESQQEWYPVTVPQGVDRIDVAGGTLAGWSAAVTMMGAARLAAGSQVTVIDLSEGAVAHDLVRLAAERGDDPLVWVLPDDLPRLDLTRNLRAEALADVLSLVVSASEEQSTTRDLSVDNAILERILPIFGGTATIRQITAALRALAQVGDPRDDLDRGLISESQLDRITALFGRSAADKVVIERAWALEAQLRKLEALGTDPVHLPPASLQVVSMDRRAGVLTNRILGTYVTTALNHALRAAPGGRRWEHTLFLCGAEKLRGDVLDRLIDACETTGTGLVLLYRSIPKHVRTRLGRGHAAVGFMRLGNAEDARVAAEHLGGDHRLLVAEITETAGQALAGMDGDRYYASTVAYARRGERPLTDPVWSPVRKGAGDGAALLDGITTVTPWGHSVAAGLGPPDERQRSREFRVERHQMQELPPTAMVFTHATSNGRRIQLVDANPGIMTLPTAHTLEYEEYEQVVREQAVRERSAIEPPIEPPIESAGEVPAAESPAPRPGEDLPVAPAPRAAEPSRARHAAPRGTDPRPDGAPRTSGPVVQPTAGKHAKGKPGVPPS